VIVITTSPGLAVRKFESRGKQGWRKQFYINAHKYHWCSFILLHEAPAERS
jgi:hypothetical protein